MTIMIEIAKRALVDKRFTIAHLTMIIVCLYLVIGNAVAASDTKENPRQALFIVHFETGTAWDHSLEPQQQAKFKEHSANLNRLRQMKVIAFGARYADLGLIIVRANSLKDAKSLIEADPGVKSGIFDFRISSLSVFYAWQDEAKKLALDM